jgi:hypothetical protein
LAFFDHIENFCQGTPHCQNSQFFAVSVWSVLFRVALPSFFSLSIAILGPKVAGLQIHHIDHNAFQVQHQGVQPRQEYVPSGYFASPNPPQIHYSTSITAQYRI